MRATLTLNLPQLIRSLVAAIAQRGGHGVDETKDACSKAANALNTAQAELSRVLIHRLDVNMLDVVARLDVEVTDETERADATRRTPIDRES